VAWNDPESHSLVTGLFRCYLLNICAAFCTMSTDSVLARFLYIAELLVRSGFATAYITDMAALSC